MPLHKQEESEAPDEYLPGLETEKAEDEIEKAEDEAEIVADKFIDKEKFKEENNSEEIGKINNSKDEKSGEQNQDEDDDGKYFSR